MLILDPNPDPIRQDGILEEIALGLGQALQPAVRESLGTPRDEKDLDEFLIQTFGVTLPAKRCCAGHTPPREAFHHAYFARSEACVWKAARGLGGKSFTLALLGLTEALTLHADVKILGGSGRQSERVLEAIGKLWSFERSPRRYLARTTGELQTFVWGNTIEALKASQASVRGPHPQRLRLDEVDEMKWSILEAALGQPMSKGDVLSHIVLSSTHQNAEGTMTKALRLAQDNGWPIFVWCKEETRQPHGWLSDAEIARKRRQMTLATWRIEVELQEPSSEGRAIDTEMVEIAFQEDAALEAPLPEGAYGTGGDWGKKRHYTCVVTIRHDCRPARVVAFARTQRRPWPVMVKVFDDRVRAYGGAAVHDNTGLGQVVDDLLEVEAEPFDMVGKQRSELLSEYVGAIENGELVWPRDPEDPELDAAYKEHKFATVEDVYGGAIGHLPDTISAAAFAWRACKSATAAGETREPDPSQSPHLAGGFTRGRMTGAPFARRRLGRPR